MNLREGSHSAFMRIASLFFVITLFSDAANFDDMFSPSLVLHDDSDIVASDVHPCAGFTLPISSVQHQVLVALHVVRLIIDQDSPAFAADTVQTAFNLLASLRDISIRLPHQGNFPGLLYLRNHTLLI
jgi:hypothetical protein